MQTHGYWASYNNAFFEEIRDLSGVSALCSVDTGFCYEDDPRAKIFKERQGLVEDIPSLQALIEYNRFQTDPLSLNQSCNVRIIFRFLF